MEAVVVRVCGAGSFVFLAFALAACGDGKSPVADAPTPSASAAKAKAAAEVVYTQLGVDVGMSLYSAGETAKADKAVGDAYLEHFEHVEGPLEKVDKALTTELETSIRDELRQKIKAGAPAGEVRTLVKQIRVNLDKAKAALQ